MRKALSTALFIFLLTAASCPLIDKGACAETVSDSSNLRKSSKDPFIIPEIAANGSTGSLSVQEDQTVTITVSVGEGFFPDNAFDWWVVYVTPENRFHSFTLSRGWVEGVTAAFQQPAFSFPMTAVFENHLEPGTYRFYFGLDPLPDNTPGTPLYLASVTVSVTQTPPPQSAMERLMPEDLIYMGAFRYPEEEGEDHDLWSYSGSAVAYYPHGDPDGPSDSYPGSLYASGHVYDNHVGELAIPRPGINDNPAKLPMASVIRPLTDITGGMKDSCNFAPGCIYRELDGLAYLPGINKLVWNLRDWYNTAGHDQDSLGWSNPDFSTPRGLWHIGVRGDAVFHNARTSNYLFKAPMAFASRYMEGKWLMAGSHREAGALGGSQGPTLFAVAPWEDGSPPDAKSDLDALALLYYPENYDCVWVDSSVCAFPNYRAADDWAGGAWIERQPHTAILIAGRKGLGPGCYGTAEECNSDPCRPYKGYHAYPYQPQLLFYDPDDIRAVSEKRMSPWEVLPYTVMDLEPFMYGGGCGVPAAMTHDPDRGYLYLAEKEVWLPELGLWGISVIHVWQIN